MLRNRRGQNTLEYALIISVVVAALLAIDTYIKKGVQGRLKESTDQIGKQFEPEKFTKTSKAVSSGKTTTTENRDILTGDTTSNSDAEAAEKIKSYEYEQWGTAPQQHYKAK